MRRTETSWLRSYQWANAKTRFADKWPPFLTANAFAVYVLHAIVITALGIALSGLVAPAIVKALVLGALGLPLCWAFAAAVRALPGAKKVL